MSDLANQWLILVETIRLVGFLSQLSDVCLRFPKPTPRGDPTGSGRDFARDPEQPGADRVAVADRAGVPGQHEERGLEGILTVVGRFEESSTDAKNHRPVAFDEDSKGCASRVGGVVEEPGEQLAIGHRTDCADLK
jgi:hypothetical protein